MSDHGRAVPASKGGLQADVLAGFLVFFIALPLCLAIAGASQYPPIMGIWTAALGGVICTFLSNSQMTIKGPAAGMIVIVAGAVLGFKEELVASGLSAEDAGLQAYRMALGIGVVSGIIQIVMGLLRAGVLSDLFPISAVHGLLASIGVIIMAKQAYQMIGLKAPGGEAIESVIHLPSAIPHLAPNVAMIGIPSLVLLFAWSYVTHPKLKKIPGQILVLAFAIPMGLFLGIDSAFLVPVKSPLDDLSKAFVTPDFSGLSTRTGIPSLILFALIGSLESLLSAKAVDLLDPQRRKTNLSRDLMAVGLANTAASMIGGLPMISEIVRSKANIDNGARSKYSNLFHGVFLLLAVLFLAPALAKIPTAALGAMLVFTGFRLAHPREFFRAFKIGFEQLLIFVTTVVVVLFTDLLIGIAAGTLVKLITMLFWGVWPRAWFKLNSTTETRPDGTFVIHVIGPIVFLNLIRLKTRLAASDASHLVVNVSKVSFIDHTSIERFHELEMEYDAAGRHLHVEGIEALQPVSSHNLAARKKNYD